MESKNNNTINTNRRLNETFGFNNAFIDKYPDNDEDKVKDPKFWDLKIKKQKKVLGPTYGLSISLNDRVGLLREFWNKCKGPNLMTDLECDELYYEKILKEIRKEFNKKNKLPLSEVLRSNRLNCLKSNIKLYKTYLKSSMTCREEEDVDEDDSLYYGDEDEKPDGSYLKRGNDKKTFWSSEDEDEDNEEDKAGLLERSNSEYYNLDIQDKPDGSYLKRGSDKKTFWDSDDEDEPPLEYDLELERKKKEVQFYWKRNNYPENDIDKEKDIRYWILKILLQCKGLAPCYANSIDDDDDTKSVELYKDYWGYNRCYDLYSDFKCDIAYYELILENVREKYLNVIKLDISPAINPNELEYLKNTISIYKNKLIRFGLYDEINESNKKPKILFDDCVYEIKEKKELPIRYEPCSCKEHQGNMYQRVSCTYNKVMKLKNKF